jgi:predicted branched-subunit amino acid permease
VTERETAADHTVEERTARRAIVRQSLSIALAVSPFGMAFGVACAGADLSPWEATGFSTLMFTGGSQFAAVKVLSDGGSVGAAIAAAVLLSLRFVAYGVVMAPALTGPLWWRALASHFMIDESMAVASAQTKKSLQRFGYLTCGASIFVLWNLSTFIGAVVVSSAGDIVERFGIDGTIPASFLALLWPRLRDRVQRLVALGGIVIALVLVPFVSPGIPILASAGALLLTRLIHQPPLADLEFGEPAP